MLGISNSFNAQFFPTDSVLNLHYKYLRRVIKEVLQIGNTNEEQLNYCIYLLDTNALPLNESEIVNKYILNIFGLKNNFILAQGSTSPVLSDL